MPLFDFICTKCNAINADVLQSAAAKPPKCPECGGRSKRQYAGTTVGHRFNGGGFHKTDYPSLGGSKGQPLMTSRNKLDPTAPVQYPMGRGARR